jgi:hypothetical protein
MSKRGFAFLALASLGAAPAVAQNAAPVRGDYERIAACVYLALDPMLPGGFHFTDLRAYQTIIITMETHGGGGTFRGMKATFTKAGEGFTAIEAEGQSPGYYPGKIRPLAEQCSAELPPQKPARKPNR